MKLQRDYDTQNPTPAIVTMNVRLTPAESVEDVRELTLRIDRLPYPCAAGQSIGVLVSGPHDFGNEHHMRLYTIAECRIAGGRSFIDICVRRCDYLDPINGERYPGIASHYLCDQTVGGTVTLVGPYPMPFDVPDDVTSNIIMIGVGTGIAPFRAFIKRIYDEIGGWKGQVRLFYGAQTGLEMLYMNDKKCDLTNYFDQDTFRAFEAVSPRPHMGDEISLDKSIEERGEEVWSLLNQPNTYVYVAGLSRIKEVLERAMTKIAGGEKKWRLKKRELIAGERWSELLY